MGRAYNFIGPRPQLRVHTIARRRPQRHPRAPAHIQRSYRPPPRGEPLRFGGKPNEVGACSSQEFPKWIRRFCIILHVSYRRAGVGALFKSLPWVCAMSSKSGHFRARAGEGRKAVPSSPPLISRQPGDRLCLDYFAPDRRASDRCLHTTATRPTFVLSVAQRKLAPEVRVLARLRTRSPACAPDPPSHATSRAQVSFRTGSGRVLEANARHHHDREC
jgi:hypothetical protein